MTIEAYLFHLHSQRYLLMLDCLENGDRQGLRLLKNWLDVRVCCSPNLHRKEWYRLKKQYYVCAICQRLGAIAA